MLKKSILVFAILLSCFMGEAFAKVLEFPLRFEEKYIPIDPHNTDGYTIALDKYARWDDEFFTIEINKRKAREIPFTVRGSGNVGIGTESPNAKLDVNGTIRAVEICDETGANCNDLSSGIGSSLSKNLSKNERGDDVFTLFNHTGEARLTASDRVYAGGLPFDFSAIELVLKKVLFDEDFTIFNRLHEVMLHIGSNGNITAKGDITTEGKICGANGCVGDSAIPAGTFCGFCKSGKTEIPCQGRKVCANDCLDGWTERELFGGHSACVKD